MRDVDEKKVRNRKIDTDQYVWDNRSVIHIHPDANNNQPCKTTRQIQDQFTKGVAALVTLKVRWRQDSKEVTFVM